MRYPLLALFLAASTAACAVPGVDFTGLDDGGTDAPPDAPAVVELVVSSASVTVAEGASATFTVALSAAPATPVLISVDSADGNRVGVTPSSVSLDGTNWNQPRTITLSGREDADTEDEAVAIAVSSSVGDASVDVTVTDNDQLSFVVSPSTSLDVTEGATAALTIHLSAQPSGPVTVAVTSSDTAAVTANPTTLTFGTGTWDLDQTVVVSGVHDADIVNASATLTLTAAGLADAAVAVQVNDDDVLGILPSTTNLGLRGEGTTTTFTVRLTQQPPGPVSVAVASSDTMVLTATPTPLSFDGTTWSTPQTVTVTLPQDVDTTDETATITLSATGLTSRTVAASVDDDDTQTILATPSPLALDEGMSRAVNVRLEFQPAADVTLTASSLNTAVATVTPPSLVFTPANYDQPQAVTVTAPQDMDALAGMTAVRLESVADTLTRDVTVAVTDDDQLLIETSVPLVTLGEGGTTTFGVRLTAMPAATITVNGSSGDTTAASLAPAMLSFTSANYAVFQTVTVAGVADVDLANETLTLTLTAAGLPAKTVDATVTDDDMQQVVVSAPSLSVNEGGTGQVGVSLGFVPAASTTVTVMSADPTAATVAPTTLTFTPASYATPQTVTVTGVSDADATDDTATINATAPSSTAASVAVTVNDDDALGIETSVTTTTVPEAGTQTVGIRLTAQPAASTVVTVASSDATAATVGPATLTFTTATWDTFQNVTLTGVADPDGVNDSITVTASATGLTTRTVNVTVVDDDTQDIVLSATTVTVGEAGTTTFGVHLATMPVTNVVVAVASTNTGKATATPTMLTFTPANYASNQTVTVAGVADVDLVSDSVPINLSSAGLPTRTVTATVTDDDTQEVIASWNGPFSVPEGGAGVTVGFYLRYQPAANVVVTVTPGAGVAVTPTTLTFTPATFGSAQNVTMTGIQDADAADVTTTVTGSAPGATSTVVNVLVADDDVLELETSAASLTVGEAGSQTFGVRLTAQPAATTTVMVTSSDSMAATASPAMLSFTTADWNTFKTVTVAGVNDVDLANEGVTVTLTSTGMASRTVGVTVTDDDTLTIVASTTGLTVPEGGLGTVGVSLSHMPASSVTVIVASGDTSAVTASPVTLAFTTSTWATPLNVTAAAINDADATSETVTVTLSSPVTANRTFTVTTVDDDIVLTSLSPQMNADVVNGTIVTFTGEGFLTGTTAAISGNALLNPSIVNATTITGRHAAWSAGTPRFGDASVVRAGNSSVIPRAFYFGGWSTASSGLSGGDVRAVAAGGSVLLAGTDNGVYRSTNSGGSWTWSGSGLPTTGPVYALVADPSNAQVFFAGTQTGIYRSGDGGLSWTLAGAGTETIDCLAAASNGQTLFACSTTGRVLRSTDGGTTWTVSLTVADPNGVAVAAAPSTNVYVASSVGVHTSVDQGITWTLGNTGLPANPAGQSINAAGGFVLVGTSSGVYRSSAGDNWTASAGLGAQACNAMVASPPTVYCAASGGGVYRSTDIGANWTYMSSGLPPMSIGGTRALALRVGASVELYLGTSIWGVYKSMDQAQSWTPATTGINTYEVLDIAPHPTATGTVFIAPKGMGIWKSTNHGASWTASNGGLTGNGIGAFDIEYTPNQPSLMWGGFNGLGVRKSTDGGTTWTATGFTNNFIYEVAVLDATTVYAVGSGGVRKTTDGGTTWTVMNNGITGTNVRSIILWGPDIYAAEINSGVYRSIDGGASWQLANSGLPSGVNQLYLDPQTDVLYAQTSSMTYRSNNGGTSWTAVTTTPTQCFAIDPARPETIWFGATALGGVRRSLTSGTSTVAMNDQGPVNPDCMAIAIDRAAQTVYCSMRGKGMYRLAP